MKPGDKIILLGAAHAIAIEDMREFSSNCEFLYNKEHKLGNILKEAFAEMVFVAHQYKTAHEYLIANGTPELNNYLKQLNELPRPLAPNIFFELHAIDLSTYFKSFVLLAKAVLDKLVPLYSYQYNDNLKQFSDKGERLLKAIKQNRALPRKDEMMTLIGQAKEQWIDSLIALRDQYAHYSSLDEYINFWLVTDEIEEKTLVGIADFHKPVIVIKGQAVDALEYTAFIKASLIAFLKGFLEMCGFTPNRKPKAYLACENCRYEFAKWQKKDGIRKLIFSSQGFAVKVEDRERDYGVIICPQCGGGTDTDITFWKNHGVTIVDPKGKYDKKVE